MYRIGAAAEQIRPPRLVRVAVVQNAVVRPTTDPVKEQVNYSTAQVFIEEMMHVNYLYLILHPCWYKEYKIEPIV